MAWNHFPNNISEMSTKSRVTTGDKWIIAKFGPAGKYKSSQDVPDMVK